MSNELENLQSALDEINTMILKAKTDKTIDKKDLELEKRNCLQAIRKYRKNTK